MQKADAIQRFVAAFIDGIVGYLPAWILAFISLKLFFVGYLIAIAYLLVKDAIPATSGFFGGQSIGKKVMKIKVIKEDTGAGIEGDWGTAIVRQVSLLIPIFGLVDALMVFGDEKKRFGDKWANTIVVKQ
jgi:uncharacterized RDD family membrane protein YckC